MSLQPLADRALLWREPSYCRIRKNAALGVVRYLSISYRSRAAAQSLRRGEDVIDTSKRAERQVPASRARRLQLLEHLEELFFREGYRSISVDELAQRLRCSKRALYEIGRNKDEMALVVFARWSQRIIERAETETRFSVSPEDKIISYLRPGVEESRRISRALLRDVAADEKISTFVRQHQSGRIEGLRQLIEEGIRSGHFRQVNSAFIAAISLSAIERIDDPDLLSQAGIEFADAFDEFYSLLIAGLRNA